MTNHPNRSNSVRRDNECFSAYGRIYTPDGWGEVTHLFFFLVPRSDTKMAMAYACALRVKGTGGAASYGCEDVSGITYVGNADGHRTRNRDRGGLGMLDAAPDGSRWRLIDVLMDVVTLECVNGGSRPDHDRSPISMTWEDLRAAAISDNWYQKVLRRAQTAAMV